MKKNALAFLLACGTLLAGAEYFVTPADSLQKAFDKLQPGDTLTLKKGVYRQGTVTSSIKGTAAKPIIIRGEDRESTIVTAWKSLDDAKWEAVAGQQFVYRTPMKEEVCNIADLKSEQLLLTAPSIHDMELFRGTYRQEKGYLYLHTPDGKKPGRTLRATVYSGYLFLFQQAAHVKIENLTFCGSAYKDPRYSSWGIAIRCIGTSDITVDRCSFYYNSGGVAFTVKSQNSVTRNSFFKRNDAPGYAEAAQLFYGGQSKNNLAENNIVVDTGVHGIRFYSGAADSTALNNIVVNARIGLYYKATAGKRLAQGNVIVDCPNTNYSDLSGGRPIRDISNTFGAPSQIYDPNKTNLIMSKKLRPLFCAPEYYDYRLQKGSPGAGSGAFPEKAPVFYLSNSGKDTNDGGSVKKPFRTFERALKELTPGSTLYIASGKYEKFVGNLKGVTLRGRGEVEVKNIALSGSEITLEGISCAVLDLKSSEKLLLKNVAAKEIFCGKETALYNCEYATCAGKAKVYNSLCKGVPVGSYPESPVLPGVIRKNEISGTAAVENVRFSFRSNRTVVHWVTPGVSGDHYRMKDSWWAPEVCTSYVEYGETPQTEKKAYSAGNVFHHAFLENLTPGKTYYCRVVIPAHPLERKHTNQWRSAIFSGVKDSLLKDFKGPLVTFTVPKIEKRTAAEYFVSPGGSDKNQGTRQAPFRSIRYAAEKLHPGDTLTLLPGTYDDMIYPIHSGTPEAPITFRAEKAGTVILEGSNFMRPGGIICKDVKHLRFQGFIFRKYANKLYANRAAGSFGMAQMWHSSDITIKDCVFSAFGTYQHPIVPLNSDKIKVENCVLAKGVSAVDGSFNGDIEIRNCTFYVTEIHNFTLSRQRPGSTVTVRNNLFVALTGVKALNRVERTGISGTNFKVDFDNNCWYFSPKDKYRYCGGEGEKVQITGLAGVARFKAKTGWGKNDIETTSIRFKGHKFYDPFEKEFSDITGKNMANGKTLPTLEFFESEYSGKYGVKAVK